MSENSNIAATIKAGLDTEVAKHQLSPSAWPEVERRLSRQRWRTAAFAGGTALVLAAATVTLTPILRHELAGSSRSGQSPAVSVSPAKPTLKMAGLLKFPQGPRGVITDVTAGYGAVWLGGLGSTFRINPRTNRVVATIPTAGADEYSRIAAGFGSIWVTGGNRPGNHLGVYRINPLTDKVSAFIRLPQGGLPGFIAVAGGLVWVTSDAHGGSIYRIDPGSDHIVGSPIVSTAGGLETIVPDAGVLWVTSSDSGGFVIRISLRTGHADALSTGAWAKVSGVDAVGAGSLWAAGNGVVQRINPLTGRAMAKIAVRRVQQVVFGHKMVWAITAPPSSSPTTYAPVSGREGTVVVIDPRTNKAVAQPIPFGITPAWAAAGATGIWIVDFMDHRLIHIDIT